MKPADTVNLPAGFTLCLPLGELGLWRFAFFLHLGDALFNALRFSLELFQIFF
jgi:hypothetical protein